ncbi:hypothetical protein Catovirus_1_615 [Catovirus CTV1]|uniref:Uncharacterized protein n=1 Tax=Catovirus CTV1 TaxID=1977631 RepID=A0A1V0SA22_9VIRU|nr:hypothetical protein Catovirus_1_615 [Catovirus CTV1]
MDEVKLFRVYSIKNYSKANALFIENGGEEYELEELAEVLERTDKGYHERISTDKSYTFFGDCDKYNGSFNDFSTLLIDFLKKSYSLKVDFDDICYTENKSTKGSYHYTISKYYAKCSKLKEIFTNFKNSFDKNNAKVIDTTVYSNHWFRCPNQSKENNNSVKHIIKKGSIKDFILENIADNSICIDNVNVNNINVNNVNVNNKVNSKVNIKVNKTTKQTIKKNVKTNDALPEPQNIFKEAEWKIYYKFFEECFKNNRFNDYEYWINVGMAIKNRYVIMVLNYLNISPINPLKLTAKSN